VALGQPQQTGEQHGRAPRLVGLDRTAQALFDLVELVGDRGQDDRPHVAGWPLAAGARIEGGELRGLAREDQVVQGGGQAQLGHGSRRRVDALEQPRHLTAVLDVVRGRAHQLDVERRTTRAREHVGVPAEARGQRRLARPGVAAATVGKL
jgi:hypothetical protein